ncbi:hypothetical protein LIER_17384 [Lithospermum erythrorhizon]|uniref:C2H2-type domain-containing protein n=1 Tax=Lithospermum erythrorhizon TaxID=34254 RepID=A0AAV3QBR4_LITER
MDIDSMDEITITMGSNKDHPHHQSMIMKGKRTKRPSQPSPASAVFTASSCSSGGDGGGGGDRKLHTKIRSSDSLCSEILSTSTEEDEDMANCLILLAQSGRQNTISTTIHINNNIDKQEGCEIKSKNIGSRKFKKMTTTIRGKDGTYVYECKTCNRSFPSFQALGGHRTSHKKHKPTVEMEDKKGRKIPPSSDDDNHQEKKQYEEEEEKGMKLFKISPSSLLSLEIANKNSHGNNIVTNNSKVMKIHECSICGAEFSSGQALGGHMRRHRNPNSTTTTATESSHNDGGERQRTMLELDLNLPAPQEEEDLHESKFQFSLFSSPSLVDCQ